MGILTTAPFGMFFLVIVISFHILAASRLGVAKQQQQQNSIPDSSFKNDMQDNSNSKRNLRALYGFGPRMLQISRSKVPIELDLLMDNDEVFEKPKRFDDYGHLRFGKRGGGGEDQFDDYGHMRFGRSSD